MKAKDYALNVSKFFVIPSSVINLKACIDGNTTDVEKIGSIISTDPGLSAHILKLANCAIYSFPKKIDSIQKAIQVIGTKAVYDYSLVFGISQAFSEQQTEPVDLDQFWEQSVCCAILTRYFGQILGYKDVDRIFTAGLLHNIGELAVIQQAPKRAINCNVFTSMRSPKQCQIEELGFSFSEVSYLLSREWSFPDELVSLIEVQHHNGDTANELGARIMQLSYELSIINTYAEHYNIGQHLPDFLIQALNLTPEEIDCALDEANMKVEQIIHLFNPDAFKAN